MILSSNQVHLPQYLGDPDQQYILESIVCVSKYFKIMNQAKQIVKYSHPPTLTPS